MLRIASLLLLPALLLPHAVRAQARHCIAADGTRVYTDRKCADLGAEPYQPSAAPGSGSHARRSVCAINVDDLGSRLEAALDAGDANRIAGLYDWSGMGSHAANAVMDRLQVVAARTSIDVRARANADGTPQGLHVEQVQADGISPAQVDFGLHQRLGCWWLRF